MIAGAPTKNLGVVASIRGSVVEIRFDRHLPPIYSLLRAGEDGRIVIEVLAQIFHNRPKSGSLYEPVSQRLLPLDAQWQQALAKVSWPTQAVPEILGAGTTAMGALIREYLFISLFRACAESLASENACRLAAMERANKNIDELLEQLHGTFHRLRQSGIDEELFDVIAGFGALPRSAPHPHPAGSPQ